MSDASEQPLTPIPGQTASAKGGLFGRLGQFLWMKERLAEVRAKAFDASKPGYSWYQLARHFCDDVVVLEDNRRDGGAIPLLEATTAGLLIRSYLDRAGMLTGPASLTDADWDNAQKIPVVAEALGALAPAQLALLKSIVGPERDAAMVRAAQDDQTVLVPALHKAVTRLIAPLDLEANNLHHTLILRRLRVGVTAVALLVLVGLLGNKVAEKFAKPNLALNRTVTISSQYPGTPNGAALVDGDRENIGFHTNAGPQQWAMIDLGVVTKFDKMVIANRSDGQHQRAVPLRVEISNDGKTFTLLREHKEVFDTLTFKDLKSEARYVRLLNTPPNYFHLAEVEVY